jgi:hypothetical protein
LSDGLQLQALSNGVKDKRGMLAFVGKDLYELPRPFIPDRDIAGGSTADNSCVIVQKGNLKGIRSRRASFVLERFGTMVRRPQVYEVQATA